MIFGSFISMELLITVTAGVFAFLFQFGGLIWKLGKVEQLIHSKIENVEYDLQLEIQKVRTQLVEAQLKSSSEFMRRESFRDVMDSLDARLIRLEGKLDTAIANKD